MRPSASSSPTWRLRALALPLLLLLPSSQAFALGIGSPTAGGDVMSPSQSPSQRQQQQRRPRPPQQPLWMSAARGGGGGGPTGGSVFEEFSAFIQEQQRAIIAAIEVRTSSHRLDPIRSDSTMPADANAHTTTEW